MNKEELLKLLKDLKIEPNEYVILSSSALMLRDILDYAGDLDIAVTEKGLEQLNNNYHLNQKENGWFIVNDQVECVLSNMEGKREKLGEYYVQDLEHYLSYIESSEREKDKVRTTLVKQYINNKKTINM